MAPRTVIAAYRPKPGQDETLIALVRMHVATLAKLGFVTGRKPFIMRAADGTVIEVFEWVSAEAIREAHNHDEVSGMWDAFEGICEYVPLSAMPEAATPFAEFEPIAAG